MPPAVEAKSLNHWTIRADPMFHISTYKLLEGSITV